MPSAVVNVYRVPDNTKEELTREEVAALMTEENLVIDNVQVDNQEQATAMPAELQTTV